jgi:predicted secreted protein
VVAWLAAAITGCSSSERQSSWGDVIVFDPENGSTVTVTVGQTLAVGLTSHGDGGYTPWALATPPEPSILRLVRTGNDGAGTAPGNFGRDVLVFDAVGAGTTEIVETTSRPWDATSVMTHTTSVVVR